MNNFVGSADSKVAVEQVIINIVWEGLVASGEHSDRLLILNSFNISVVRVLKHEFEYFSVNSFMEP